MATIAITGASGLVGRTLAQLLRNNGHRVLPLVRRPAQEGEITWDPSRAQLDPKAFEDVDQVVHLAGENIAAGRWTKAQKQRIYHSRVLGTQLLSTTLAKCESPPTTLISASASGYYQDRGADWIEESEPPVDGFLGGTCRAWEAACDGARAAGMRVVHPRIGLVLDPKGGVLGRLLPIFRLGLGGKLGPGRQFMSWITNDDLCRAILFCLELQDIHGPVNAIAPNPVTNLEFTKTLGRVLGRPTILPAPSFALRLATGTEFANALLLRSARLRPGVLQEHGFEFEQPELEAALRALLGNQNRQLR